MAARSSGGASEVQLQHPFLGFRIVPVRDQNNLCKFLVAFVSIKLSIEEIDEIRTKFEEHLDSIFFPREFKFLEKYPVNSSGKTDRKLLENQVMK